MGVKIETGHDGRERVVVRCDHAGCKKTATRKMEVFQYDRRTGQTYATKRNPRSPFPYWLKVFADGKSPFHLHLREGSWPEGVKAYCDAHNHLHQEKEAEAVEVTQMLLFPFPEAGYRTF